MPVTARLIIDLSLLRKHKRDIRIIVQELEQLDKGIEQEDMVFVSDKGGDAVSDASLYRSGKLEEDWVIAEVYGLRKDQIILLGKNYSVPWPRGEFALGY